ncbi:MAG: hypothetical protein WCE94_03260 [Candidatus Methanoperedens sp.]
MGNFGKGKDLFIQEGVIINYKAVILKGPRGAGKTTVARKLCEKYDLFQIVKAVTTRKQRKDDSDQYLFINKEEFNELERTDKLLIKVQYAGQNYGITHEAFQRVINNNKTPLLIIAPNSTVEKLYDFTIFLNAPDKILNDRLIYRGQQINETEEKQRNEDRTVNEGRFLYAIENINVETTVDLIWSLWEYRNTGGILPKRLIQLMIECGMLLKSANLDNITGAAYDLSIGDEYYYGGKIKNLTDREPFILIEPYDYAIVTSKEITNLPRDVTGRFDLSVGLFCQGMILSNGPQVDPGFRGRLFCLLFNTSNAPVVLKRGQHYATIEFNKLIEPTSPYDGKYQDKYEIIYYLPSNTMRGAINELKKELEGVRRESRNLQAMFLGVISLILAIIAILLVMK